MLRTIPAPGKTCTPHTPAFGGPAEADFLREIVANPEDVTPRLVFADWLEERGQSERAEFIRTPYPPEGSYDAPRRQTKEGRRWNQYAAEQLVGIVPRSWRVYVIETPGSPADKWQREASWAERTGNYSVERRPMVFVCLHHGFVCGVTTREHEFEKMYATIFRNHPIRWAGLLYMVGRLEDFAGEDVWVKRYPGRWPDYSLPDELFNILQGGQEEPIPRDPYQRLWRRYPTRAAAWQALGDACVRLGRQLAGLPEGGRR